MRLFGAAALALGVADLVWPGHYGPLFTYATAGAQIVGGLAIVLDRHGKAGALLLTVVYCVLAALLVPPIAAMPLVFDPWGDFFEEFTLVVGAGILFASLTRALARQRLNLAGRLLLGICAITFAVYQAVHPDYTAGLVPKWLPPGQMFWMIATTVSFALAALSLVVNRMALLATRLLTLMLVILGVLVWLPQVILHPRSHGMWEELLLTFAIAGAAWIVADLLAA